MDKYVKGKIKSRTAWLVAIILATVWFMATVLPFIYMVLNAFKGQFEMLKKGVFQLPDSWYPTNFIDVLQKGFLNYFLHSIVVLIITGNPSVYNSLCLIPPVEDAL